MPVLVVCVPPEYRCVWNTGVCVCVEYRGVCVCVWNAGVCVCVLVRALALHPARNERSG